MNLKAMSVVCCAFVCACASGLRNSSNRMPASDLVEEIHCVEALILLSGADRKVAFEKAITKSIQSSAFLEGNLTREVVAEALFEFEKAKEIPRGMSRRKARRLLKGAFLLGHPQLKQLRTPYGVRVSEAYLNLVEKRLAEKNLVEALKSVGLYKKSLFEQLRVPQRIRSHSANILDLGLSALLTIKLGVFVPPIPKVELLPTKRQWEDIMDVMIHEGPVAAKEYIRTHFKLQAHANYVYGHARAVYLYTTVSAVAGLALYGIYLEVQHLVDLKAQMEQIQERADEGAVDFLGGVLGEPLTPEEAQRQLLENILDTMEKDLAASNTPFDREAERRLLYEQAGMQLSD